MQKKKKKQRGETQPSPSYQERIRLSPNHRPGKGERKDMSLLDRLKGREGAGLKKTVF